MFKFSSNSGDKTLKYCVCMTIGKDCSNFKQKIYNDDQKLTLNKPLRKVAKF